MASLHILIESKIVKESTNLKRKYLKIAKIEKCRIGKKLNNSGSEPFEPQLNPK